MVFTVAEEKKAKRIEQNIPLQNKWKRSSYTLEKIEARDWKRENSIEP